MESYRTQNAALLFILLFIQANTQSRNQTEINIRRNKHIIRLLIPENLPVIHKTALNLRDLSATIGDFGTPIEPITFHFELDLLPVCCVCEMYARFGGANREVALDFKIRFGVGTLGVKGLVDGEHLVGEGEEFRAGNVCEFFGFVSFRSWL